MSTVSSIDKKHAGFLIGALAQLGAKREGEEIASTPNWPKISVFIYIFKKLLCANRKSDVRGDKNNAIVFLTFHSTGLAPKSMENLT